MHDSNASIPAYDWRVVRYRLLVIEGVYTWVTTDCVFRNEDSAKGRSAHAAFKSAKAMGWDVRIENLEEKNSK